MPCLVAVICSCLTVADGGMMMMGQVGNDTGQANGSGSEESAKSNHTPMRPNYEYTHESCSCMR